MKSKDTAIKVLIVEDSDAELELFNFALRDSKLAPLITLWVARDGMEAMELLQGSEKTDPIELVLLDINLPLMSGLEVLRGIRQQLNMAKVKVIIVSNSDYISDITQSYEFGANAYFQKPADYDRLVKFCTLIRHSIETVGSINMEFILKDLRLDIKPMPDLISLAENRDHS